MINGVFSSGTGTIAGIHWTAWVALPAVSAVGGALASVPGRRGYVALGAAGGSLLALAAFAVFEMKSSSEPPKLTQDELRNLLR